MFFSTESDETFLLAPDLVAEDPEVGFVTLTEIESSPYPIALRGPFLISMDDDRVVSIVNIDSRELVARLMHPAATNMRLDVRTL